LSLYRQSIPGASSLPGFQPALARAEAALVETARDAQAGALHALTIAQETDDLKPARALAARLREAAEHVVVLGVGGSSLGGQAIAQLKGFATPLHLLPAPGPRLHFIDNLDAPTFDALLSGLPLSRTHFLAISKSGATAETLMQTLVVIAALEKAGAPLAGQISVVTEARPSPLRRLADERGFTALEHPADIGGRFSVLSVVGLLPALLLGLSPEKIRSGAARTWRETKAAGRSSAPVEGAAFAVAGAEAGKAIGVMMPYSDRLERFAAWYRQLWAESLGKSGKGTLPVSALGPVDQHSQLQLYLGGPKNALFTIVTDAQQGIGPLVPPGLATGELSYLGGHRMGDLVAAEARATLETLTAHDRPCRLIETGALDEERLGALFMHFMLETILSAHMMGVNAFDQPAVEEGKLLAKRYLSALPKT
jgi:glucose-6-phosphate isomerase